MNKKTAYDNILKLRDKCLPFFKERQKIAVKTLYKIFNETDAKNVWDLGCGTGEITKGLARLMPEREFIGVDNSRESIRIAKKEKIIKNLKFKIGSIDTLKPVQQDFVLSSGNTLIHFGAMAFGFWLGELQKLKSLPRYFFIDFIEDWNEIVKTGNLFRVSSYKQFEDGFFLSGMNTVKAGGKIIRELMAIRGKNGKISVSVMPVEQFSDPTSEYFKYLRRHGYRFTKEIIYEHGYGIMKGGLWSRR